MEYVVDDLREATAKVVLHLSQRGFRLDFSPSSFWEVDRFFDEHGTDGQAQIEGTGAVLFGLGGYVGEVVRRSLGGQWQGDDSDPDAEINLVLRLDDGSILWPVQRVMKRLTNGGEDAIVAYAVGLGIDTGEPPKPAGFLFKAYVSMLHDPSPSATRKLRRWFAERRSAR